MDVTLGRFGGRNDSLKGRERTGITIVMVMVMVMVIVILRDSMSEGVREWSECVSEWDELSYQRGGRRWGLEGRETP